MVKFGASIYCLTRLVVQKVLSPVEAFNALCDMGAEAVELVPFGFDIVGEPALQKELLAAADKRGVPIENFSLNANFLLISKEEYEAQIERAKRHIDACAEMGIPTIRVDSAAFSRPISENTIENFEKELPTIVGAYETLCDYAARYGMTVLLENHGFHANGSERVRRILTSVKRENFGHQLDVGNYICVDDKPEIAVKKMIPFAKTIHMKDFYVRPFDRDPGGSSQFACENSWFRSSNGTFLRGSILAQGDLDIWRIMKTVRESGYDGTLFLEYEGMEECRYATSVSLANMKRIWNEV